MNYNDHLNYVSMFTEAVKEIKVPDEIVGHPSEEIDKKAKEMLSLMTQEVVLLDLEESSIDQQEDHTLIEAR